MIIVLAIGSIPTYKYFLTLTFSCTKIANLISMPPKNSNKQMSFLEDYQVIALVPRPLKYHIYLKLL